MDLLEMSLKISKQELSFNICVCLACDRNSTTSDFQAHV